MATSSALLQVQDLSVRFRMYTKGFSQGESTAITNLSLSVHTGEIVAVVGSSGSGKSLLAHALLGLLPTNAIVEGDAFFNGEPLTSSLQSTLRGSQIALIPQSVSYLDPLMRVGNQVRGTDKSHRQWQRQQHAFAQLSLCDKVDNMYPFQLSGGMARRVLFSTAVVSDAMLIIADEPTPGMHLEQAKRALQTLRQMADDGKGVLLITHDIDLALEVADKIAVFYAGTVLETTPVADFAAGPDHLRHPYSKALWQAMPQNGFVPLPGTQPSADTVPCGCLFAPRCPHSQERCLHTSPPMRPLRGGNVRCYDAT